MDEMLKILEDRKAQVEQDLQALNGQMSQLQQALQNGQARTLQLQGAYENVNILIEEVKKYGPDPEARAADSVQASADTQAADQAVE